MLPGCVSELEQLIERHKEEMATFVFEFGGLFPEAHAKVLWTHEAYREALDKCLKHNQEKEVSP